MDATDQQPATRSNKGRSRRAGTITAALAVSCALALASNGTASAAGVYHTTAAVNVRSGPSTATAVLAVEPNGASFTLICQWQGGTNIGGNATWDRVQFANGVVGAISDYPTNTPSWNNYAPGTPDCSAAPPPVPTVSAQMQSAANWAIAEKNSPDPTWSDRLGHPWSGWCEAFAEQAEGFTFRFPSAIADYQLQAARGRIHTDTNPPVGALVYYGAGGGYGHVAVSIGGGQAIGTYGYVGQRLPVRQYPVTGYLSNPYIGWANPIGS